MCSQSKTTITTRSTTTTTTVNPNRIAQVIKGFEDFLPKRLQVYGHFKFLTVQCLIIQTVSSLLHVLAHFVKSLEGARDLVFTTLAQPIGSVVVYTFWLVWFGMGRELMFPAKLDEFYPFWLNQTNHTMFVPINILLAVTVSHQYTKKGALVTLIYLLSYTIFLHVFKAQTGQFVYFYLNEMSDAQRLFYFACTAVFAYLMYKSGEFLQYMAFGSQSAAKKPASKGAKQR
jgi:hypothetical protein